MSEFDEAFDFVVAGSGGGSMCAGLLMKSAGKSVLILEKTDLVGGSTARSGGVMWIPNNRFMKRAGIEDSFEKASTYLDSLMGDAVDAPGASRARRRAYLTEAPRMIDLLVSQGVKLTRIADWPDYHDELPGGSTPSRTVVAELFDANELGPWKQKLRPTFIAAPAPVHAATLEEMMDLSGIKHSWSVKMMLPKLVWRGAVAKLTGKQWVAGGAAFYAVAVYPGDVGTYGGVVTDEFARVLREDGSIITGLYATGVSTASVMGRAYPGAGASIGPAFTFGYIAARHAANMK